MSSIHSMESFIQRNSNIIDYGELVLDEAVDINALRIIRDNFHEVYKRMDESFWVLNKYGNEYVLKRLENSINYTHYIFLFLNYNPYKERVIHHFSYDIPAKQFHNHCHTF